MRINDAACKIACPQVEMGGLHLMRSGLAINCIRLINDSVSPFVYEHVLQDFQCQS